MVFFVLGTADSADVILAHHYFTFGAEAERVKVRILKLLQVGVSLTS
jgi:hypothetical protein